MQDEFEDMSHRLANSDLDIDENIQIQLYGLYKQATQGDCYADQPWTSQKEAYAKWSVWFSNRGMLKEDAMKIYIEMVKRLLSLSTE